MNDEEWGRRKLLVVLLLVLQLVSVLLMWALNPVGQQSQASFALLLASDLVAFSIVSYVARRGSMGEGVRGYYVMAGSAAVFLFVFLALVQ